MEKKSQTLPPLSPPVLILVEQLNSLIIGLTEALEHQRALELRLRSRAHSESNICLSAIISPSFYTTLAHLKFLQSNF